MSTMKWKWVILNIIFRKSQNYHFDVKKKIIKTNSETKTYIYVTSLGVGMINYNRHFKDNYEW